jgi:hypothetical protein
MKVGMKLISEVITSPLMNQLFSTRHEFKLSIYQHHFEIPFPIDRNAKLRLLDMTTTIPNPYKPKKFHLQQQQQQQQPTMGIQSQPRDGSIASARRCGAVN